MDCLQTQYVIGALFTWIAIRFICGASGSILYSYSLPYMIKGWRRKDRIIYISGFFLGPLGLLPILVITIYRFINDAES